MGFAYPQAKKTNIPYKFFPSGPNVQGGALSWS